MNTGLREGGLQEFTKRLLILCFVTGLDVARDGDVDGLAHGVKSFCSVDDDEEVGAQGARCVLRVPFHKCGRTILRLASDTAASKRFSFASMLKEKAEGRGNVVDVTAVGLVDITPGEEMYVRGLQGQVP